MKSKNSNKVDRPIILGIVGDSATGKTTLSQGIVDILGRDRVTVMCTDDYHKYDRIERQENKISALDPNGNYVEILEQHLNILRRGEPVLKPIYNHNHGTLDRPVLIRPKDFVIAEGLLGYTTRKMRDCYDVKIYLDPEESLRIKWKIHRDTSKRGYTKQEVLNSLKRRTKASPMYIHPQRIFADIVISFYRNDPASSDDQHLDVRHILRPTLPHPDLTPLLSSESSESISINLSRDRDGKPVDILKVNGSLSDEKAEKVESLLWSLLPEAGDLRKNIGQIEEGLCTSHPLALTQLLIAYHVVKAEYGIHAV